MLSSTHASKVLVCVKFVQVFFIYKVGYMCSGFIYRLYSVGSGGEPVMVGG